MPRFSRSCCSFLLLVLAAWLCTRCAAAQSLSPADLINPLVGTAAEGQTFPGVGVPFGMTAWTPSMSETERKGIVPYYANKAVLRGFRGSHFPSGSATQEYGSFQLLAGHGILDWSEGLPVSRFQHAAERAHAYQYEVELPDLGVEAAITGLSHSGLMRFRFHDGGPAWINVTNNARGGDGEIAIDPTRAEITGRNAVRRLYAGSGQLAGFFGFVVVQFDHPFHIGGTWSGGGGSPPRTIDREQQAFPVKARPGSLSEASDSAPSGAWVTFDVKPGEAVQARIGMSFVSIEEARRNLTAEIPGWNFEAVAAKSRQAWNRSLDVFEVEGDPLDRRIFYTALYHCFQLPRSFSDVDGSYPRFAGGQSIEQASGFTYYDDFSAWDTFRALHPLLTVVDPTRESEMIRSLIAKGQQGGFLPIFPAWNSYTSEMVGDHVSAIIADGYLKGIRGFDAEAAWQLMRQNAFDLPRDHAAYVDGRGRRALNSYLKYGFVPLEDPVTDAFHKQEQVSRTLEYAYDDFVDAEMAHALGHTADEQVLHKRAKNYLNVIDPDTGYARGRHADGSWVEPFEPGKPASYITEGLPSQYTFFVPQDLHGLIALEHGNAGFLSKLDALFDNKEYDHGNEPSHHIAYLFDYVGAASKTQQHVFEIRRDWYRDRPDGLAGNDDAGQMSAWYVFSAIGFYPVTPGIPAYTIGTPLFPRMTLHLPGGKNFRIVADGVSPEAHFIRSVMLNGKPLNRFWLRHEEIAAGGELHFQMSDRPVSTWPSDLTSPH